MIQTEPESQPAVEVGLRRPDRDVGPAVAGDVADERDALADVLVLESSGLRREVDVEPVRIAVVPEVVEVMCTPWGLP